jgi:hypothetical protein
LGGRGSILGRLFLGNRRSFPLLFLLTLLLLRGSGGRDIVWKFLAAIAQTASTVSESGTSARIELGISGLSFEPQHRNDRRAVTGKNLKNNHESERFQKERWKGAGARRNRRDTPQALKPENSQRTSRVVLQ